MKRSKLEPGEKPLRRSKRMRQVNRARAAKRYAEAFGEKAAWIRTLACAACRAPGPSDPHHVRSRGAGGKAADLVPLCRSCHDLGHRGGWSRFGLDLKALSEALESEWKRQKEVA
jgi:hypothetical protein